MENNLKSAAQLHKDVPPNWYFQSIRKDPFQKYWHERRFEEVGKLIEPVKGKVLDVGSADGVFSKLILDKSKAKELIGIEAVKTSVKWANTHWKKYKKMKFMVGDAHKLPFAPRTFDALVCLEVLEHVNYPKKVLGEFKRVLKKGGYVILLVPSDSLLFRIIWFFWLNFYPRGWVWRDTHIQTYRKNYLTKLCKTMRFKIVVDIKFNLGMLHLIKVRNS